MESIKDDVSGSVSMHSTLALEKLRQGDVKQSKFHTEKILELEPKNLDALFLLGKLSLLEGQQDEARCEF